MITKKVLVANRIRRIDGGFSFIPHRFLTDGFLLGFGIRKLTNRRKAAPAMQLLE